MATRMASTPPTLAGYSYVRPLGSGGFADVFLYEQDMPRRVAAVKVLLADAVNREVLRTFNVEADISARLSAHPSIVTIYQASISADGRPYFAMEYCPDTMSARYKKAPLALADVLDTGVRIAGALETVHRAGLLHRDIKPSNVLINSLGAPVLADFGIAAAVIDEGDGETIAMSVPWSSPEVLQERVSGSVPSEIWSLGATLYTLLAGRSPFERADRGSNSRDQLTDRIIKARYTAVPVDGIPRSSTRSSRPRCTVIPPRGSRAWPTSPNDSAGRSTSSDCTRRRSRRHPPSGPPRLPSASRTPRPVAR